MSSASLSLLADGALPSPNAVYAFIVIQFALSYAVTRVWGEYLVPNVGCLRRIRLDVVRGVDYYSGARWYKAQV